MTRVRNILFGLVLCLLALLFSGCGRRGQIAAIEAAITAYNGCYFEIDDPAGQIRNQEPGSDGSAEEIYRLKIRIPDYKALDLTDVPCTLPPVDYDDPDETTYRKAARDAFRGALESYASTHDCPAYLEDELELELNPDGRGYRAEISRASENDLLRRVNGVVSELLTENEARFPSFRLLTIAGKKAEILSWIFDDPGLVDAFTVTSIDDLGDGAYRMHLSYPDLKEVYNHLGDALYASYNAPIYDRVTVSLTCGESDLAALSGLTRREAEILVRYQGGSAVPEEDNALWQAWYDAKSDAEKTTRLRLETRFLVTEKAAPKAGLLSGVSRGNPLILNMKRDSESLDCFVALYRVSDGPEETGQFQFSAYIPAGKTVTLKLPAGQYRAEAHFGTKWYGEDHAFGPEDLLIRTSNTLKSQSGYSLELYLNSLLTEE